jgi:hypothetical protein
MARQWCLPKARQARHDLLPARGGTGNLPDLLSSVPRFLNVNPKVGGMALSPLLTGWQRVDWQYNSPFASKANAVSIQ